MASSLSRVCALRAAVPAEHEAVFQTLRSVAARYSPPAVLRVAGGWVRDMLLGLHSNDIDIAIETAAGSPGPISGTMIADAISKHEAEQSGGRQRTVSTIRMNPVLSKHIETATVCVHDIPVEFCALRTDDYCDDSRIPQVRPATPLEDALRRDFTVNALFYNLETGNVEDFTTGLADLDARLLRCPLDPRQTFEDDPLRLLRGVRFVGQLGDLDFRLDASIPACVDDALRERLVHKVSRERIGKELTKMLTGARPDKCVGLLLSMQLLQQVLLVEVYMKAVGGNSKRLTAEIDRVVNLIDVGPAGAFGRLAALNTAVVPLLSPTARNAEEEEPVLFPGLSEDDKLVAVLFVLLIPFFRDVTNPSVLDDRIHAVAVCGLKMRATVHTGLRRMIEAYQSLVKDKLQMSDLRVSPPEKGLTGGALVLFEALSHLTDKTIMPSALKVVLLTYTVLEPEVNPGLLEGGRPGDVARMFAPVWKCVEDTPNLLKVFEMEPIINGNDLRKIPGVKPKDIGSMLLYVRKSMLVAPTVTREEMMNCMENMVRYSTPL